MWSRAFLWNRGICFFIQYYYVYLGKDAPSAILLGFLSVLFFRNFFLKTEKGTVVQPIYLVIIVWLVASYFIPYMRSLIVTPMVVDRYTIVTLPAWILLFAIGWKYITALRVKYAVVLLLTISAIGNLFFFRNYYTRVKKDQWREASEIVINKNKSHFPIYSTVAWHFTFYFRNQPEKINDLYSSDLSGTEKFWFLVAHLNEEEQDTQIRGLEEGFKMTERYTFFGANAVLFERKHK